MRSRVKQSTPTLPTLPLEYRPRLAEASDTKHARHYLLPGKVFASAEPAAVTTIVGSSVALCMWDAVSGCGGAVHFLMSEAPQDDQGNTKYADAAGETLYKMLLEVGATPRGLEAKIFGGLQPAVKFENAPSCLGNRNVEAILKFLAAKGIRLAGKEVGGNAGRKVIFHTDDGCTWSEAL